MNCIRISKMALGSNDDHNTASPWCEICSDDLEGQNDSIQSPAASADAQLATMFCENCRQRLCDRCGRRHNRLRFATDHRVVELGEEVWRRPPAPPDETRGCGDSWPGTCSKHGARPLEIYCRDCRELGCVLCTSLEAHRDHRWCDLDAASREIRRCLSRHLEHCLLYTSPSPRDRTRSRMPSSA